MRAILLIGLFTSFLLAVQIPFLDMTIESYEVAEKQCANMLNLALQEVGGYVRAETEEERINAFWRAIETKTLCILTRKGYGTKFEPMNYDTFKSLILRGLK